MTVIKRSVRPATTTSVVDNVAVWDDTIADKIKDSGIPIGDVGINFAYQIIDTGVTILIPEFQQMTVHGSFILDGTLEIDGQFVLEL